MGWCSFGGDTETIDGLAATPTMLDTDLVMPRERAC